VQKTITAEVGSQGKWAWISSQASRKDLTGNMLDDVG